MTEDPLKELSDIYELASLSDFLKNDEDVKLALSYISKFIAKPDISPEKAKRMVIVLDALSARFAVQATYYMTVGRNDTDKTIKKNIYFTLKESTARLSDAVKYSARSQ